VSRAGFISFSSHKGDRPTSYTDSWPTAFTNVVIQRNYITNVAENGILPEHTISAIVQNNVLRGANLNASIATAGIWAFDANNTLFQFNEVSDVGPGYNGHADGTGYDEDYDQDHTVFQYNYSHNNSGGFMLSADQYMSPYGTNGVVQYNVSLNDGQTSGASNMGGASFHGNTVYLSAAEAGPIDWIGGSDNIFSETSMPATYAPSCTGLTSYCSYNLLFNINPVGTNNLTSNPQFFDAGYIPTGVGNLYGYQVNAGSPVIGAGTLVSGLPALDYFGNSISSTSPPNMGADDGTGGSAWNLVKNAGFETGSLEPWSEEGTASATTTSPHTGIYSLQLGGAPSSASYSVSGLSANTTYTLSGWIELATAGDSAALSASDYDTSGNSVSKTVTSTAYVPTSLVFTTGTSSTGAVLSLAKTTGTGAAYGDDFVLHRENVANPGFESGILVPWVATAGSATVDEMSPATGLWDLHLNSATTVQQTVTGLQPYTSYTFTGYAKVSTAGQTAMLAVGSFDSHDTVESSTATSTAGYTYIAQNFTTGPLSNSAVISASSGTGSGGAYADDLFVSLNMLENPDFESGGTGAWQLLSNATISQAQPHSGSFALVTNGVGSTGKQVVCGLKPSTSYIFSAWAKLGDSSEAAHLAVQQFDSARTVYETDLTTTYKSYPQRFTTGTSNTCVTVDIYQTGGSGSAYLDDVSLAPAPTI
jgi:Carbohydrate binding domain